jgi:hypothetical protein
MATEAVGAAAVAAAAGPCRTAEHVLSASTAQAALHDCLAGAGSAAQLALRDSPILKGSGEAADGLQAHATLYIQYIITVQDKGSILQ